MQQHPDRPRADSPPRVLTPSRQRADAPLVLRIADVTPDHTITIVTSSSDHRGRRWSALAVFRPRDTVVDVARDPAITGSYRGVDPDGLITRMQPEAGHRRVRRFVPVHSQGFEVHIHVEVDGRVVAGAVIERVLLGTGVTVRAVDVGRGATARLYVPPAEAHRGVGVIAVVRRSSVMTDLAPAALASRGYPSASLLARAWPLDGLRPGSEIARLRHRLDAVQAELARLLPAPPTATLLIGSGLRPGLTRDLAAGLGAVRAVAASDGGRDPGAAPTTVAWVPADREAAAARVADGGTFALHWVDDPLDLGRMPGEGRADLPEQRPATVLTRADAWEALLDELRRLSIAGPPRTGAPPHGWTEVRPPRIADPTD